VPTVVNFVQPPSAAFSFQATLDGNAYTVSVPWNLYGQRYYVLVSTLSGTLVVALPRISGTTANPLNLVAGYFTTSTLWWNDQNQQFTVTP